MEWSAALALRAENTCDMSLSFRELRPLVLKCAVVRRTDDSELMLFIQYSYNYCTRHTYGYYGTVLLLVRIQYCSELSGGEWSGVK